MASNENKNLLHCTGCNEELNLESKTLPCLHSFCRACLGSHFTGETEGNGECSECQEPVTPLDQLSLSPFLAKSLRCRELDSINWTCDLCSDEGIASTARNWCQDCQKLHCANCSRWHEKFQKEHNIKDLAQMERGELIKLMTRDTCHLHQEAQDSYCEQCNVCLCNACYKSHSAGPTGCASPPLCLREEALKLKSEGPVLAEQMVDLERSLRSLNERAKNYTDQLNFDCDSKCRQLWEDMEKMMENAKQKTDELCKEVRKITDEQVKRWHHLLKENDNILKQLEIWHLNLQHLLNEVQQDVDVVCGLHLLKSKLSSQLQKSIGPEEKCQLEVKFPNWYWQVLEQLKNEKVGLVSLTIEKLPAMNLVCDKEWNLCGSNPLISSIHIGKEDYHVFLCDRNNNSVIELTEGGEFVCECYLFDLTTKFKPYDICPITSDIFIVACGNENTHIILERSKTPPFLRIKQLIDTKIRFYSACQINESIFVSDLYFQVDSITKNGKTIKTLKTGGSRPKFNRIRVDPSSGNFWGAELLSSELFCFDSNGEQIRSVKTEEIIIDFCVNEFGDIYFCNDEGIFSIPTKRMLYKFGQGESAHWSKISVISNKMFVCLQIHDKYLIKIFKIFY